MDFQEGHPDLLLSENAQGLYKAVCVGGGGGGGGCVWVGGEGRREIEREKTRNFLSFTCHILLSSAASKSLVAS